MHHTSPRTARPSDGRRRIVAREDAGQEESLIPMANTPRSRNSPACLLSLHQERIYIWKYDYEREIRAVREDGIPRDRRGHIAYRGLLPARFIHDAHHITDTDGKKRRQCVDYSPSAPSPAGGARPVGVKVASNCNWQPAPLRPQVAYK